MKLFHVKILALVTLCTGSLIQGYAILRAKEDQIPEIPFVSANVWQVGSPQEAQAKEADFESDRLYMSSAKSGFRAKLRRGSKHAYHYDIGIGFAGRNAEQKLDKKVYVYLWHPGKHELFGGPFEIQPKGILAFILVKNPNTGVVRAELTPQYAHEYIRAEDDKRNIKQLEKEAKERAEKIIQSKNGRAPVPRVPAAPHVRPVALPAFAPAPQIPAQQVPQVPAPQGQ